MTKLDLLAIKMMEYDKGDSHRIQHFIKVHSFCRLIGTKENMKEDELFILEAAALTHDIGIKKAMEVYGNCDGKHQEELGPEIAEKMLEELDFTKEQISRICYLIAHHHTYDNIDGLDYQILVEADFLVNLHEGNNSKDSVKSTYDKIFKTNAGREICTLMFNI